MIDEWTNKIHCGHVLDILRQMPSKMVDVCVTSPPYWGLRDYGKSTSVIWDGNVNCEHEWYMNNFKQHSGRGDCQKSGKYSEQENIPDKQMYRSMCVKCEAWNGQLGLEPHPQMYINHIVEIFREVKRVLKDTGTLWLNIGDTYCEAKGGYYEKRKDNNEFGFTNKEHQLKRKAPIYDGNWLQPKQKLMIPERVAIAMQDDGWILRNKIIWFKPNHMPSSVADRLSCSYESVFFFSKGRKYYFDLDSIRVPHKSSSLRRVAYAKKIDERVTDKQPSWTGGHSAMQRKKGEKSFTQVAYDPKGKNPGDTWIINTKPFKGAHFATFPTTLIERILKCAAPREVCSLCGKPRERIIKSHAYKEFNVTKEDREKAKEEKGYTHHSASNLITGLNKKPNWAKVYRGETIGWTKCNCNEKFKGGIVLDTFIGSGTTALVAKQLGLNWIGIELNEKYAKEIAIPRIEAGSVELYDVNRCEIPKSMSKEIIVNNSIPTGKNPKCIFKAECTFKVNGLCYMNPKKRVKYCTGIDK